MWGKKKKTWKHYPGGIMAIDISSAGILSVYTREIYLARGYLHNYQVADLQRYRLIRHPAKVYRYMMEKSQTPFVFFLSKN